MQSRHPHIANGDAHMPESNFQTCSKKVIFKPVSENRIWENEEMEIIEVKKEELPLLAELASLVWHEYFPCILTEGQIDYMVEKFQSLPAMTDQVENQGYEYYFLRDGGRPLGYMGIRPEEETIFLSKLYLTGENRGKGYASEAFSFLEEYGRRLGKKAIWLTVNKYNDHSIRVYRHRGFETVKSQVSDIGNGYVMDDYVMEKKLSV